MKLPTLLILLMCLGLTGCETTLPLHISSRESRVAYVRNHPDLEPRVKRAIKGGRVVPGMTKEEVSAAWGEPHLRGVKRWEYTGWRNIYVLFENGLVVSVNRYSNL